MKRAVLAALFLAAGLGQAAAQDAAAGEKVFAVCKACHQVGDTANIAGRITLPTLVGKNPDSNQSELGSRSLSE